MKYRFTDKDKETLKTIALSFDPLGDMTDDEELALLAALDDKWSDTSEEYGDVYQHMAEQAE